jgi:hypothetical protein
VQFQELDRGEKLIFWFSRGVEISNKFKTICSSSSSRESDKQIGFSILIDRRNDKWSSVRNVLILIQV